MLTKEHVVDVFQKLLYFHVCESSYSYWSDVMRCVCVNKRDVENETREIIVENKLWCRNVALLIVDQIMPSKNGQLFSLSLKNKVYVECGSNS